MVNPIKDQINLLLSDYGDFFSDKEKEVIIRTGLNITAISAMKLSGQDVDDDLRLARSILLDFGAQKAVAANTLLDRLMMNLIAGLTTAILTKV
jgi:hypothetical protein